jgi:hypothetical protein
MGRGPTGAQAHQKEERMRSNVGVTITVLVLSAGLALAAQPTFTSRPASFPHGAPLLPPPGDPVSLIFDDGVPENNIGLNSATTATQFAWLNLFSLAELPVEVSRIDVYFGSTGTALVGGEAIELVVWEGGNAPCTTGETYRGGQNATIGVLDDFNQYTLTTPVQVTTGPSVGLGVVDRFVVSGVTTPVWPAALDATASQGGSWVASYSTDPPVPPTLPSDGLCGTIDSFGFPGNWMIRGAGTVVPVELQHFAAE